MSFCEDPTNHKAFIRFCGSCAVNNRPQIIICAKCKRASHTLHSKQHQNYMSLSQKKFTQSIQSFINYIQMHRRQFPDPSSHPNLLIILNSSPQNFDYSLFQDDSFRNWAIKCRFWTFSASEQTQRNIQEAVRITRLEVDAYPLIVEINQEMDELQKQFSLTIDWGSQPARQIEQVANMLDAVNKQMSSLSLQQFNLDILIRVFCAYTKQQIQSTLKHIETQLILQPKNIILYLAKLNLLDLHMQNYSQWLKVLNKACQCDQKFKTGPAYNLYDSFKYWRKINSAQIDQLKKAKKFYVVNSLTKQYYVLTSPQEYVNMLTESLIMKKCPKNGIFYGYRALGYLAQNKNTEAIKDFQAALNQVQQLDTVRSNMNYARYIHSQTLRAEDFLNRIQETKSREFLINGIKYFKKTHQPRHIISCCEALLSLDENNLLVRCEYAKAQLKQFYFKEARTNIEILKAAGKNQKQLKNIKRKELYAQSRFAQKNSNHDKCVSNIVQILKQKQSASACFSYASALYNSQNYTEANIWIDKALAQKKKEKYKTLKFYICLMKRQFEEARDALKNINNYESVIHKEIIEFLDENQQ